MHYLLDAYIMERCHVCEAACRAFRCSCSVCGYHTVSVLIRLALYTVLRTTCVVSGAFPGPGAGTTLRVPRLSVYPEQQSNTWSHSITSHRSSTAATQQHVTCSPCWLCLSPCIERMASRFLVVAETAYPIRQRSCLTIKATEDLSITLCHLTLSSPGVNACNAKSTVSASP